jgi:hypothetical protein
MGRYAKPKWAWFLDGKDVDRLTHQQLQSACKKARVSAAGGSDALRIALRGYLALKEPPVWFVDGMQYGESAATLAAKARTVQLTFGNAAVSLSVGQRLEHAGSEGKCTAETAQLVAAEPEGCLVERHRRSQAGSRSGFIGGPTKDIATFEAAATGTATVALLVRRGAASPLQQQKVVRVSILPGQDS